jgi:acetyl-CoA carboxylase biotin carboxyl carrier protein
LSEKRKNNKKSPRRSSAGGGPMDVDLLEQIVRLMAANDLSTVDVRDGDKRIMLRRGAEPTPPMSGFVPQYAPMAAPQAPAAMPNAGASGGTSSPGGPAEEDESKFLKIKSPMVGTFYAAPAKGAKPFVTVGSRIEEESDVCIVEAMKVFNNIKAECRGTIAKILVQDSQAVEFGQTLFLVKAE